MNKKIAALFCLFLCAVCSLFCGEYEVVEDLAKMEQSFQKKTQKIRLSNGIEVLLISDESFSRTSVALAVDVGSWDDPKEHPGMAHFVEHLVFLGTKNYPKEGEFKQYVQERGGRLNASTYRGKTVYGFSLPGEDIKEGLERFTDFFIEPLFTESAIEREVYAVHHEFEDSIENEFARIWRVFKETGNREHPNANFSFGNLDSLEQATRDDVVSWFEKHYASHSMKVVILSPFSLDKLSKLSAESFGVIPEKTKIEKETISHKMSSSVQEGRCMHIDSLLNSRILSLVWEIPKEHMTGKKLGTFALIQSLLNHNYPNSLASSLEKEGLIIAVKADLCKVEKDHAMFRIDLILTPLGVKEHEKVIERCFQALAFLQENPPSASVIREVRGKEKVLLSGDYQVAMQIALELVETPLSIYPQESVGFLHELFPLMQLLLDTLSPKSCMYFLVAPSSESGLAGEVSEQWMGTKYVTKEIAHEELLRWESVTPHPMITLWEGEVLQQELKERPNVNFSVPHFVLDSAKGRFRLIQSLEAIGVVEVFFCIATPGLEATLAEVCAYEVLALFLKEKLGEGLKELGCDSLRISIENGRLCVYLKSEKEALEGCLHALLSALWDIHLEEEEFAYFKEKYLRGYAGDPDPLLYAQHILELATNDLQYSEMDLFQGVLALSYEQFSVLQCTAFTEGFIEGSFLGDLSEKELVSLIKEFYGKFPFSSYTPKKKRANESLFADGPLIVSKETHRKGNSLILLVASENEERMHFAEHQIIAAILQSEFFHELRTRQQTAYRLYNWSERVRGHLCHGFALQSSSYCPFTLLERVEGFLLDFARRGEEIFTEHRVALIRNSLISQCQQQRRYRGDKGLEWNIRALRKVDCKEIIRIVRGMFSPENQKRIAILIKGENCPGEELK